MCLLVLNETKMKGKGKSEFGHVIGKRSDKGRGRVRKGVAFLDRPKIQ